MSNYVRVASKAEIGKGRSLMVEAGGRQIALFNCAGSLHAIDNRCKHRGGPLHEGDLEGTVVTCPGHGWAYDVTTGSCAAEPDGAVQRFEVRIDGDDVMVAV